ncbi:MAG: cysteine hydrolase [Rhodococcus sp.]|nr:cysteine hydrolase [Rhodococcus sp. (in: high G+C Gram-positive bacteria)]
MVCAKIAHVTDYVAPHWGSAALVVIDVQQDFLDDGDSPIPGTSDVLPQLTALVQAFRAASRPIVHVVRLYEPGGSDIDLIRRDAVEQGLRVVAPGSDGAQIPQQLLPAPTTLMPETLLSGEFQHVGAHEVIMFKPRWSAFHRTNLAQQLADWDVDTVVIAGCNLPNCPRATLFDASERDFRAVLVHDAVSQTTDERLTDLEKIGIVLTSADAVIDALS